MEEVHQEDEEDSVQVAEGEHEEVAVFQEEGAVVSQQEVVVEVVRVVASPVVGVECVSTFGCHDCLRRWGKQCAISYHMELSRLLAKWI